MNAKEFNIQNIIDELMKELKNNGIPFDYTIENEGFGGHYKDNGNIKDGRNHSISIFIGEEKDFIQNGMVNEERLMGLISTIYHEYRHLEQTEKYKYNPDFSKDSVKIARMNAIQTNGFTNYYFENYRNDPKELDATKYGFEESVAYVSEKYPEIDATRGIEAYIHSYIEEDRDNQYGFHMFDEDKSGTLQDILKQLQDRIDNPTRVNLAKVCEGYIEDDRLRQILTKDFIQKYESCGSTEEKDNLILAEVVKLHPEILSEYPVLQNEIGKEQSYEYSNDRQAGYSREEKENVYIESQQQVLKDYSGDEIGNRTITWITDIKSGTENIKTLGTIENDDGKYTIKDEQQILGGELQQHRKELNKINKLTGQKEQYVYQKDKDGNEMFYRIADGHLTSKITKNGKGTTIDYYDNGQIINSFEYDENGTALIGMEGIEQLDENYVENLFDTYVPYFEAENRDLQTNESKQVDTQTTVDTQKLGKETLDVQKDTKKVDEVESQMSEHMREQQKNEVAQINEFGEIIRPQNTQKSFRESMKFDVSSNEYAQETLKKFTHDLENGTLDKENSKKKEDYNPDKTDDDYVM